MITITVPDNASLEVVLKAYVLEVLRIHPEEAKAAEQIGINRTTLASWLEDFGIIVAYVQDGPNVIPARQRKKKSRAARAVPQSTPPSKPVAKRAGLQSIMDEAAALRAAHERRGPGGLRG